MKKIGKKKFLFNFVFKHNFLFYLNLYCYKYLNKKKGKGEQQFVAISGQNHSNEKKSKFNILSLPKEVFRYYPEITKTNIFEIVIILYNFFLLFI